MILDSGIPVWLKISCENGHHESLQLDPQSTYAINEGETGFQCPRCGTTQFNKITVDGSSNQNIKTLEQQRKE